MGSSLALGATLIYFAGLGPLVKRVPGELRTGIAFAFVFVGYFAVRFFGQGVLTSASRNILLAWFERRRGFVSGLRGGSYHWASRLRRRSLLR